MKQRTFTRILSVSLSGATLLGTILFVGASASAVDITQTVTQGSGVNWVTGVSWGSPASVPLPNTNYITPSGFVVRTTDTNNTPSSFPGDKLTLINGSLYMKNGNGAATVNLVMNPGTIQANTFNATGTPALTNGVLAGTLQVLADSTIKNNGNGLMSIWLQSAVSGSGNLTVTLGTNILYLSGDNSAFGGNWTNTTGGLSTRSGSTNVFGSGRIVLQQNTYPLRFDSTNDMIINNIIDGIGSLTKINTNTVTLGGNNSYAGTTVVSNGVLKLTSSTAISSSPKISLRGGTVDASSIGGLVLNAGNNQSMDCNGSVTGNLTVDSVNPLNFNVTSTTNDILNVSGSLTLSSTPVTLNVSVPAFKAAGSYRLINYVGAAIPTNNFNLVLVGATSQTYVLSSSANQLNLVVLGVPKSLTWQGYTDANWDSSTLNWTNSGGLTPTNFATADSVLFDDSALQFTVTVANSALLMIPASMTVSNDVNAYTIQGDGIAPTGTLTKKGSGILILTSPSNSITGPIDIQAGTLSVGASGGLGALGTPSAITNNGTFRVNKSSGSDGVTLTCPVSGFGSVEVTNGAVLTLTGSNSYTGFTTVSDLSQIFITSSNALGTTDSGTRVLANGKLGFNGGGVITIAEPLFVNGTGVAAGPGALYGTTANTRVNFAGPVTIESNSRFRVVGTPLSFSFSNTVSGDNVNLWCTPGNASTETADTMTFAAGLTLGASGSLLKDGPGSVLLNSPTNVWGSTVVSAGNLIVNGLLDGGTVTVSGGALAGTGTNNGPVDVQAAGSIAPGNNGIGTLTLSSTLANFGSYTMQINRTNVQNADKLVADSIPVGGTVLKLANTGPALQFGDSFDLFDGAISGPVPAITLTGNGFAQPNYIWDTSQLLSSGVITVATSSIPYLPLATTEFAIEPTQLALTWTSFTNQLYTIEYTFNLAPAAWTVAQTNIAPTMLTNLTSYVLSTVTPASSTNATLALYQMVTADATVIPASTLVGASALTTNGTALVGATWITNNAVGPYNTTPVLGVSSFAIDYTTATNTGAWFMFTLTNKTATALALTNMSFNVAKGGSSTGRGYGVLVTTPTTVDEEVRGSTEVPTVRPNWTAQTIDLSGFASLQNIAIGQTVTFKIAIYTPASTSSLEFDDITVSGNVSPGVPNPLTGANTLFLRVKQQ